jgi:hypothetical protein
MKKSVTLVFIALLMLAIPFRQGDCQTANDSYLALKKMEAKTQVGISHMDYAPALAETKFEVERFMDSKSANKNPELTEHLRNALTLYIHAKDIYDLKMVGDTPTVGSPEGELVRKVYPKAISHPWQLDESAKKVAMESGLPYEGKAYNLSEVLSGLWRDASKEIKQASLYLKN